MNKVLFLLAIVCAFAFTASAQTPNFAGTWKLDTSKLNEQMAAMIKSQTKVITQSASEITDTTTTERNAPPAGGGQGGGGGFGGGMGPGGPGGPVTYKLDGSEVVTERDTPNGKITTKTTAKINGSKLEVTSVTATPNGDRTSKTTWELSADGKTLTVKSTRPGRDGAEMTTETVFTKS
ncbi:MAG: hypothetical protein K1X72_23415 [Pyrinomonadaceae bacterium]|nr:hypothetical protein [Pyrinomonadaceae bacterium]